MKGIDVSTQRFKKLQDLMEQMQHDVKNLQDETKDNQKKAKVLFCELFIFRPAW